MSFVTDIKTFAALGSGVIGSGWVARALANGLDVVAWDPAPGAEAQLRARIAKCWGAPADTTTMKAMVDNLPGGVNWAAFGIGRMQMPMAAQAVLLGGHVRVGLEDNLWLDKGVPASNGSLVERVIKLIECMGARPMSPAAGRVKMGLKPRG